MPTKSKKTRKHQGIIQSGGNKGKLKKGYKYSGKKLKSGLPQILKVTKKKNKSQRGGLSESPVKYDDDLTKLLVANGNNPPDRIGEWILSPSRNYNILGGPRTIVYKNEDHITVHITLIDKNTPTPIVPERSLHNQYWGNSYDKNTYDVKVNNRTLWDIHATEKTDSKIYHVYGVNKFDDNHQNGTFVYTSKRRSYYGPDRAEFHKIKSDDYSNMIEALVTFIQSLQNMILQEQQEQERQQRERVQQIQEKKLRLQAEITAREKAEREQRKQKNKRLRESLRSKLLEGQQRKQTTKRSRANYNNNKNKNKNKNNNNNNTQQKKRRRIQTNKNENITITINN